MTVRAKFRCIEKSQKGNNYGAPGPIEGGFLRLAAVQGEENKTWTKWTPSGTLDLHITNPDALTQFEVGKDYFLDFTPAE